MALNLEEVDKIEIHVLVDNELDPISPSPNPAVQYASKMRGIALAPIPKPGSAPAGSRGDAFLEFRMDSICCAAHGLSMLITATKGDTKHTLLFDTGPEEDIWERNATRVKADIGAVERIHLSHWHRDHSGGMLQAIRLINAAKPEDASPLVADLHPDRPDFRGFQIPGVDPISLEADPAFDAIGAAGAVVDKQATAHTVLDNFFLVSGEIPRKTTYEEGLQGAIRYDGATGQWVPDPLILDERSVTVNLKGKGLVVFTGCSHAGVVNTCRHAVDLADGRKLHAVVGGFHLSDNDPDKLKQTVEDLKQLQPDVIMPGHCTGWRFKFDYEQAVPGSLVPCFVGTKYLLEAEPALV